MGNTDTEKQIKALSKFKDAYITPFQFEGLIKFFTDKKQGAPTLLAKSKSGRERLFIFCDSLYLVTSKVSVSISKDFTIEEIYTLILFINNY